MFRVFGWCTICFGCLALGWLGGCSPATVANEGERTQEVQSGSERGQDSTGEVSTQEPAGESPTVREGERPETPAPDTRGGEQGTQEGGGGESGQGEGSREDGGGSAEPGAELPEDGADGGGADAGKGSRFFFRVFSKTEDTVPPKLQAVTFSPTTVVAGGLLQVSIETKLDLSDVISAQASLQSPNGKSSLYVTTSYHPSKKQFVGLVRVPPYVEGGKWIVSRVTLLDGAGNPAVFLGTQDPLKSISLTVTEKSPDLDGPTLQSLTLGGTQVKAGEGLSFSLKASDNSSGIRTISVSASGSKGGSVRAEAYYHTVRQRYEGTFKIPASAQTDTWTVNQASLADWANNFKSFSANDTPLKGLTFSVTASGSSPPPPPPPDTQAPQITAGWLQPSQIQAGEHVQIFVKASDQGTGIQWAQVSVADPLGAGSKHTNLWYNPSSGLWEGTIQIPLYSRDGAWSLNSIQMRDGAGNTKELKAKEIQSLALLSEADRTKHQAHLHFVVQDPKVTRDLLPPTVKGLHLAPGTAKTGESIRVYTRLEDPGGSGIQFASCTMTGPAPNTQRQAALAYNSDTGFYEGNITFAKDDPPGKWWLSGCYLQDNAGHRASVSGLVLAKLPALNISSATSKASTDPFVVTVTNGSTPSTDQQAPSIKSFHLAPGKVKAGENLRFFAKLEDTGGSGIKSARCSFFVEERKEGAVNDLAVSLRWNPATSLWEGNLNVSSKAAGGGWLLQSCVLEDNAGNQESVFAPALGALPALSLSHVSQAAADHRRFEVQALPPSTDTQAPTYGGINLAPSQVKPGEALRVYLQAADNESIEEAFCALKPPLEEGTNAPYGSVVLRWNPVSQFWEGDYAISSLALPGTWSIARCRLTDGAGNQTNVAEPLMTTIKKLDISSILGQQLVKRIRFDVLAGTPPPPGDKTAPQASSVRWLPGTQVKAGNEVYLEVNATDQGDGVASLSATLKSPSGRFDQNLQFGYNPATQRWEAVASIPLMSEDGKWVLSSLIVRDKANNQTSYTSSDTLLQNLALDVQGSQTSSDKTPPEFKTLRRGQGVVLAGSAVRISADIQDSQSGVFSASVTLLSPSGSYRANANLQWNPATSLWEGEAKIPAASEDGVWKASSAFARDQAGQIKSLTSSEPLLTNLQITVRGATKPTDTTAPTISQLMAFPAKITAGESVRLYAQIKDDISGVGNISMQVQSPNAKSAVWTFLKYNPATSYYEGNATIPPGAEAGTWKVSRVEIRDNAGNSLLLTDKDAFLK